MTRELFPRRETRSCWKHQRLQKLHRSEAVIWRSTARLRVSIVHPILTLWFDMFRGTMICHSNRRIAQLQEGCVRYLINNQMNMIRIASVAQRRQSPDLSFVRFSVSTITAPSQGTRLTIGEKYVLGESSLFQVSQEFVEVPQESLR